MKYYDWNRDKNEELKKERGVCFEDVVRILDENSSLDIVPNSNKYPNQKVFVIKMEEYIYLVPFVEDDEKIFLKTIIPSRKATKEYLAKKE